MYDINLILKSKYVFFVTLTILLNRVWYNNLPSCLLNYKVERNRACLIE